MTFKREAALPGILTPNEFIIYQRNNVWMYACLHEGKIYQGVYPESHTNLKNKLFEKFKGEIKAEDLLKAEVLDSEARGVKPLQDKMRTRIRYNVHRAITEGPLANSEPKTVSLHYVPKVSKESKHWFIHTLRPILLKQSKDFAVFETLNHATSNESLENILIRQMHHSKAKARTLGLSIAGRGTQGDERHGDSGFISLSPFETTVALYSSKIEYSVKSHSFKEKIILLKMIDWEMKDANSTNQTITVIYPNIILRDPTRDEASINFMLNDDDLIEVKVPTKAWLYYGTVEHLQFAMLTAIFHIIDTIEDETKRNQTFDLIKKTIEADENALVKIAKHVFKYSEAGVFGSLQLTVDNLSAVQVEDKRLDFKQDESVYHEALLNDPSFNHYPILLQTGIMHCSSEDNKKELFEQYSKANLPISELGLAALESASLFLNREYSQVSPNSEYTLEAVDPKTNQTITVYRPEHGTVHTLRTMILADEALDYFAKHAKSEAIRQYCSQNKNIKPELEFMMAYMVTGRESEAGHGQVVKSKSGEIITGDVAFEYRKKSAALFAQAAKNKISDQKIAVYSIIITYMCNPDFEKHFLPRIPVESGLSGTELDQYKTELIALYNIATIAHVQDLPRVKSEEHVKSRRDALDEYMASTQEAILARDSLHDLALNLITASGEISYGNGVRNQSLFCRLSNNTDLLLEQMKKPLTDFKNHSLLTAQRIQLERNKLILDSGTEITYSEGDKKLYVRNKNSTEMYDMNINQTNQLIIIENKYLIYSMNDRIHQLNIENSPLSKPRVFNVLQKPNPWQALMKDLSSNQVEMREVLMYMMESGLLDSIYKKDRENLTLHRKSVASKHLNHEASTLINIISSLKTVESIVDFINIVGPHRIMKTIGSSQHGIQRFFSHIRDANTKELIIKCLKTVLNNDEDNFKNIEMAINSSTKSGRPAP